MQSQHLSGYSSEEYEIPSAQPMPNAGEGFAIIPQDASILNGYIEDFQRADTETRKKILEKVMGELYSLWPPNSAFDKKEAKMVFVLTRDHLS